MFLLGGTVLNNTRLEQVYLHLFKRYTLIVTTTTVHFNLFNRQVVIRKLKIQLFVAKISIIIRVK